MVMVVEVEGFNVVLGIGYICWVIYGGVIEVNVYLYISYGVVLVYNGIIENYEEQCEKLCVLGYMFELQIDIEVIVYLIYYYLKGGDDLLVVLQYMVKELIGVYVLVVVSCVELECFVCVCMGCLLLVGLGEGENFVVFDVLVVILVMCKVIFLEEGDIVEIWCDGVCIFDEYDQLVECDVYLFDVLLVLLELGLYCYFMQKEIYEQLCVLGDIIEVVIDVGGFLVELFGKNVEVVLLGIEGVQIIVCGISYYLGLIVCYWIEVIVGLLCSVEIVSEYCYCVVYVNFKYLIVIILQFGEMLDMMEVLKYVKLLGYKYMLLICNVLESVILCVSELVCYICVGVEIGVVLIKVFIIQLVVLFQLIVVLGKLYGCIDVVQEVDYLEQLCFLLGSVQYVLNMELQIVVWVECFVCKSSVLFLGRGLYYLIVLEGVFKFKEIFYIYVEVYLVGELKYGLLVLVDEDMLVVVIVFNDSLLEKVKLNMQEVCVCGGELFVFVDQDSNFNVFEGVYVICILCYVGVFSLIVYIILVQLLVYYIVLVCGIDVDKLCNLVKSVMVE